MSALQSALAALGQQAPATSVNPTSTSSRPPGSLKRKAGEDGPAITEVKAPRLDGASLTGTVTPIGSNRPYQGTARPSGQTPSNARPVKAQVPPSTTKTSKSALPTAKTVGTVAKPNSRPNTPINGGSKATSTPTSSAPKRGFAAFLEKAKAQHASKPVTVVGAIKHKPIDRVTGKERKGMISKGTVNGKAGSLVKGAPPSAPASDSEGRRSGAEKIDPTKKKPMQVGYKGTMKPNASSSKPAAPSYKGTMRRPGMPVVKVKSRSRPDDYEDDGFIEYDDEDGYGQDEGDRYDSEGSSDMEAGFDDLEEENQKSLKQARQDDAKEEALLSAHAREKERRKQALAELAAKRQNR